MWAKPSGAPVVDDTTSSDTTSGNTDSSDTSDTSAGIKVDAGVSVGATVKEIAVTGANFSFSPAEMRVKLGDTVRITFTNAEGFHDLVIDEFGVATKQLKAGGVETVEFVASKTGTFESYCSVGSHRAMGMVGKLIVE
jgi:plastocyanin